MGDGFSPALSIGLPTPTVALGCHSTAWLLLQLLGHRFIVVATVPPHVDTCCTSWVLLVLCSFRVASRLLPGCFWVAFGLFLGCFQVASRLLPGYLRATFGLLPGLTWDPESSSWLSPFRDYTFIPASFAYSSWSSMSSRVYSRVPNVSPTLTKFCGVKPWALWAQCAPKNQNRLPENQNCFPENQNASPRIKMPP